MTNLLAFHRQKATTDHSKWPRWPFALHSNICIIFYSGSKSFTDTFRFSLSFALIDQNFTLPRDSFWRVTNIMSKSMSRSSRYILTIGRKGLWTPGRPSPVLPFVKLFHNTSCFFGNDGFRVKLNKRYVKQDFISFPQSWPEEKWNWVKSVRVEKWARTLAKGPPGKSLLG